MLGLVVPIIGRVIHFAQIVTTFRDLMNEDDDIDKSNKPEKEDVRNSVNKTYHTFDLVLLRYTTMECKSLSVLYVVRFCLMKL